MAPDHISNTGCLWLEANRHSQRLFNKNATKLDISTVNNKIGFMRSLDLFCLNNTNEPISKVNREIILPKNNLSLKECSVVISDVKCDICGYLFKNENDVENHKSLHHCLTNKEYKVYDNVTRKQNILNHNKKSINESCIECNNNSISNIDSLKIDDRLKSFKKSKGAVTKVTLKIGGEIISEVYCKNKYLSKPCRKKIRTASTNHDDCKSCNEIENILRNNKINPTLQNTTTCRTEQPDLNQSNRNDARIRKMAAALVEFELLQKKLRISESSDFFSGDEDPCEREDDAVVPEIVNRSVNTNDIVDDDIQEVLEITRNMPISDKRIDHESSSNQRMSFITTKDYEIITIDDEILDEFEDDCIIVDERLSNTSSLRDEENCYVFHISNNNNSSTESVVEKNITHNFSDKRKLFSDPFIEDEITLKKQKIENVLHSKCDYDKKYNTHEIEKENRVCQEPNVKLSQFALPLRLINF